MSIRVSNLRLSLDEPEASLPVHLARALGIKPADIGSWRILRKSLDARVKDHFQFVYAAEIRAPADESSLVAHARRKRHGEILVELHDEPAFQPPRLGSQTL